MRRRLLVAGCSLLALALPAGALGQTTGNHTVSQAVSNTIAQNVTSRGYTDAEADAAISAASAQVVPQGGGTVRTSWLDWIKNNIDFSADGWLWPFSLLWSNSTLSGDCDSSTHCVPFPGYAGGASGGAGASGDWDEDCEDFVFKLDASGNLVVPSIPLPGGMPIKPREWQAPQTGWVTSCSNFGETCGPLNWVAAPQGASILYTLHLANAGRGSDQRGWEGVWRINWGASYPYETSSQAYYDSNGVFHGRTTDSGSSATTVNYSVAKGSQPCPEGEGEGGNVNYYIGGTSLTAGDYTNCVAYYPNYAISPSGYYYAPTVGIPFSSFGTYIDSFNALAKCPIDPSLIAKIADKLYKSASDKPGYSGPPYAPVTKNDVRTGGEDPKAEDLKESPTTLPTKSSTSTPPAAQPDPNPSNGGTPTPDYSYPSVPRAEPTAPEINWWPTLPTIQVDLGSPECPVYTLDLSPIWDEPFTLNSHCQLIEDNRATISTMMIVIFTIAAVLIVLGA